MEGERSRRKGGSDPVPVAYSPYPKQAEFHTAGAAARERLFLAGNQVGKTLAGASELSFHATGLYPLWWAGRRWNRPVVAWAAGITAESTRDNPQRLLLGRPGRWGSGMIPIRAIAATSRAAGVRDLVDTLRIRHVSGGESILSFKFYEKGRERWQGRAVMGAIKRFWGRSQGRYASTGSANAYLLTPDVPLAAYVVGERYSFRANFANTGAVTLNISGLGAKAIKKATPSGKVNLAAGDIQSGQPITAEYDGTDMVMTTPAATTSFDPIPPGAIVAFAGAIAPAGWLLCDGSAVSRTTFAALFAAISTAYGPGDGSTTFNLPDLRGRTTVGKDDLGGSAANRLQVSTTINTTSGSASAVVASAANLAIGMFVVSANVPAGTTVTAISGTALTLSAAASATATGTAARFSLLSDAQSLGASGGSQVHTLVVAQMPAHTHTYNDWNSVGTGTVGAGSNFAVGVQTGSAGGGQPHPNLQPSLTTNFVIKA